MPIMPEAVGLDLMGLVSNMSQAQGEATVYDIPGLDAVAAGLAAMLVLLGPAAVLVATWALTSAATIIANRQRKTLFDAILLLRKCVLESCVFAPCRQA